MPNKKVFQTAMMKVMLAQARTRVMKRKNGPAKTAQIKKINKILKVANAILNSRPHR